MTWHNMTPIYRPFSEYVKNINNFLGKILQIVFKIEMIVSVSHSISYSRSNISKKKNYENNMHVACSLFQLFFAKI